LVTSVQRMVAECNANAMDAKKRLDTIDSENRAYAKAKPEEGAHIGIRVNIHRKTLLDFKTILGEFHDASGQFTKNLQDTSRRQLQVVGVKENDIEQVIASGKVQEVMQKAMVGSEQLDDVIHEIEERHAAVIKLERSVREVQQLFVDMATLVDVQQDSLDVIGSHLTAARAHTEHAADNIKEAEVHQGKARKKQCIILIVVLVVLVIIIAPIIGVSASKA